MLLTDRTPRFDFWRFIYVLISFLAIFLRQKESIVRYSICFFLIIFGFLFIGIIGVFLGLILGWFSGWFLYWLHLGRYRAKLQPYLSAGQVFGTTHLE